ncbi:hypothetical protein F2P81_014442 [Scophthalmus maximus]|uniref:Reverse transcriptase/retrotransposon-derived protein RNase H-like domain-containing protein n=1 Tax=Scophthalmus maximus TaxID=52904 RepID=A0A6A4SP83_SCOMX|nr:hypothetical protein F2P81_014442 [Scophthalmus maximus]
MATVGSLSEFVERENYWIKYVERLEDFFLGNDITDEGKKQSFLLSVCRAKTYRLIRNMAMTRKPGNIGFRELVTLQNHHNPKPSVIVQCFKFHTHSRKAGVSAAAFVAELRQLSEYLKLCVDPKALPRFSKPQTVPYAMKAKVEAELKRLQQLGVIEPIKFSDWAAPIVPVLKEDGEVAVFYNNKDVNILKTTVILIIKPVDSSVRKSKTRKDIEGFSHL